jgi:hypothetical protein
MVDLKRQITVKLTQWIVRQLGHVYHCIKAGQISGSQATDILDNQLWLAQAAVVEPATLVVASVNTDDLVTAFHQIWSRNDTDVAAAAG